MCNLDTPRTVPSLNRMSMLLTQVLLGMAITTRPARRLPQPAQLNQSTPLSCVRRPQHVVFMTSGALSVPLLGMPARSKRLCTAFSAADVKSALHIRVTARVSTRKPVVVRQRTHSTALRVLVRTSSPRLTGIGASGAQPGLYARRRYGTLLQSNPVAFLELQLCLSLSRRSPSHSQKAEDAPFAGDTGTRTSGLRGNSASVPHRVLLVIRAHERIIEPRTSRKFRPQVPRKLAESVSLGASTLRNRTRATRPSLQLGSPPLPYTVSAAIYGHNWGRVILIRLPFYKPQRSVTTEAP